MVVYELPLVYILDFWETVHPKIVFMYVMMNTEKDIWKNACNNNCNYNNKIVDINLNL